MKHVEQKIPPFFSGPAYGGSGGAFENALRQRDNIIAAWRYVGVEIEFTIETGGSEQGMVYNFVSNLKNALPVQPGT